MEKPRAYRISVCGTREKFSEYCVICVTIGILTGLLQEACQSSWVQRYSNSLKKPNVFQTFLWTSCICPLHFLVILIRKMIPVIHDRQLSSSL